MKVLVTKAEAAPSGKRVDREREAPPGALSSVRLVTVDAEDAAGQRLDNFLVRHCKGVPKSHLYQLIRSGQVRVNGGRARAETRLSAGDRVRIPPITTTRALPGGVIDTEAGGGRAGSAWAPAMEFPVIHEDDGLLVIEKPAGVAVHGGSGVAHGVIERLRAARPQAKFLELVHRLDRETSGLLMIARKRSVLTDLQQQLRERRTEKRYFAVVVGRWPFRTRTIDDPLHRFLTSDGERRVRVQSDGQSALTRVTGLARVEVPGLGTFSLVEARIETGRTHQIRVHLAHAGCPIAGDEKYGDFELNKKLSKIGHKRMFLHAYFLQIKNSPEGRVMAFRTELPVDFEQLLASGPCEHAHRGDRG